MSGEADGLHVIGGRGGIEVAVDDLRRAARGMRSTAATVESSVPNSLGPMPWGLPQITGALASLLARVIRENDETRRGAGVEVAQLRDLASATDRAAAGYAATEETARGMAAGLHDQAMAIAALITAATGPFGLLDEGEVWDVSVSTSLPPDCLPRPTSTDGLLAGIQSLGKAGSEGGVRVTEVLTADGSTTWVVQIPGTHGGWTEGGEVPMDWPANVTLMLGEVSASKVAVDRALELAQAGREGPHDRVVLSGHSQGGIIAASLASDPEFTRRHHVSHVLTAGSPIDDFPIPDRTEVLSLQHRTDPVHALDVSPPPDRAHWTTVEAAAPIDLPGHLTLGAHTLTAYRATAQKVDRSDDVSLRQWRAGLVPALAPAAGSTPVVHEYRSRRRWQNRAS
ncbi:hypothetical protein [Knoellia subterranea]|uniref:GPI inositol-deacylase PGAP1-like alpha/beta domain-containing protein n=1 Tax=Knoellia subterranea KCTC 19937 TaxID=1385521 RepID=A0A0A0JLK7_9MICO|nr:hypothetical protein [Knoellia subterranea]KGN38340.1 hypothetical protein N803_10690 [Knoellia subterranea KCTC 19937]